LDGVRSASTQPPQVSSEGLVKMMVDSDLAALKHHARPAVKKTA
jgi:hypothetical protein